MIELFRIAALAVEAVAVVLLMIGLVIATGRFALRLVRGQTEAAYNDFRQELGRCLILSLEILIAADIIYTIAVDQTIESLGMLGILVVIRTFLSVALEMELTGRWPWQSRERTTGPD